MPDTNKPPQADPQQEELARGTPPARTPETLPENTDFQPDQNPLRDTPDLEAPGGEAP
ncbi:hypothetical protein AWB75_00782 [Caballeronia catudaia]|uniref:Uncharacterized protein n=1 Tax=Caballeronia catudaia TaxID=1777136 RepID=A0A157ZIW2_9BURK|nr:hypothetical protein [Caballeronia catudaia]SAK45443.1 hypothetical protein AWB75_00782 [Caballeronia catudaia]